MKRIQNLEYDVKLPVQKIGEDGLRRFNVSPTAIISIVGQPNGVNPFKMQIECLLPKLLTLTIV